MEEKKKSKKIITISIITVVLIVAIIGIVTFILLNSQKMKLYDTTLELGQENYLEELTKEENVYIKGGYTYSVKDNEIDINNVGTYNITFEIKGEGKTTEETKQIKVVDTTPPTVELKKDTFYIGDNINIEEIVTIKDLSQEEEIKYNEAKAKVEGEFDTSKEGETTVKLSVTDKNGNTGTQDIAINVKNPIINLYDYVKNSIWNNSGAQKNLSYDNDIIVNYKDKSVGVNVNGSINFTKGMHEETMNDGFLNVKTICYFDSDFKVNKIEQVILGKTDRIDIDSETGKDLIDVFKNELENLYNQNLKDKEKKIKLFGKTVEQLKNETIDIRELN